MLSKEWESTLKNSSLGATNSDDRRTGRRDGSKAVIRRRKGEAKLETRKQKVGIKNGETKRREIPLCASRPPRRSESGRKASACSVRNDSGGGVSRYVGAKAPTPERRPARGRRDKGWPTRRTLSNVTRTLS